MLGVQYDCFVNSSEISSPKILMAALAAEIQGVQSFEADALGGLSRGASIPASLVYVTCLHVPPRLMQLQKLGPN